MVEAAGIEPASRCISVKASTCVVHLFRCQTVKLRWTGSTPSQPEQMFPHGPVGRRTASSLLLTVISASQARPSDRGRLMRPERTEVRHLLFLPGVFRGLPATSTRNLHLNLPGRVHSPPDIRITTAPQQTVSAGALYSLLARASARLICRSASRRLIVSRLSYCLLPRAMATSILARPRLR